MSVVAQELPIGRRRKPEDIARVVLWLASKGAWFVIGHILVPMAPARSCSATSRENDSTSSSRSPEGNGPVEQVLDVKGPQPHTLLLFLRVAQTLEVCCKRSAKPHGFPHHPC
jgi:hypothetical protein